MTWVCPCSPPGLGPDLLVVGLLPLVPMLDDCFVVFLLYFKHIFVGILACPPVNDESPNLVELVSYNP